jgi:divalent metal cation (Fe/Co/Zn/Cd) transporter
VEIDDPERLDIHEKIKAIIGRYPQIRGFHDFRIVHEDDRALIVFDIIVPDADRNSADELKQKLQREIAYLTDNQYETVISVEQAEVL